MSNDYPDYNQTVNKTFPDVEVRAKKDQFESNKYNVGNYMYPSDLLGDSNNGKNKYGGNYVIFYINVSTESKLIKNGDVEVVADYTPRVRGELVGSNITAAQAGTASVIGGFGAGGAGGLGGGGFIGGGVGAAVGAVVGAGVALGASAIAKTGILNEGVSGSTLNEKLKNAEAAGSFSRQQKRLKDVIALHIPNNLEIKYGSSWSEDETAGFSMLAQASNDIATAFNNSKNIVTGADSTMEQKAAGVENQVKDLLNKNSSVAAALGLNYSWGKSAISAGLGMAANPKKEQIFEGVDFRTFSFEYQFFPRDEKEAQQIQNIIYMFKYHMHPEFKDTSNFLYLYPSEFDISYYKDGEENTHIHKHTSCVLIDLGINYTPNGTFTSFANGMPTQINISLTFRELGLLTKERIDEGY